MTFGERLRELRTSRGLSVGALAHAVGVTEGAIRQMESGQTKQASVAVGLRLARVLNISPEELAGEPEPSTQAEPQGSMDHIDALLGKHPFAGASTRPAGTERLDALQSRLEALELRSAEEVALLQAGMADTNLLIVRAVEALAAEIRMPAETMRSLIGGTR